MKNKITWISKSVTWHFGSLWKESLNSDGHQFHQDQQNELSPLTLTQFTEHKKKKNDHDIWCWKSRSFHSKEVKQIQKINTLNARFLLFEWPPISDIISFLKKFYIFQTGKVSASNKKTKGSWNWDSDCRKKANISIMCNYKINDVCRLSQ